MNRNRRRPVVTTLATIAVLLGLLDACGKQDTASGSASGSAYCDGMEQAQADLEGGQIESGAQLAAAFAQIHHLSDRAPASVKQDWATVDQAITDLEDALHHAGLDVSDLGKVASGDLPDGVDASQLQAVTDAAQGLQSKAVTQAGSRIEADAMDQCGTDVNLF